MLASIAVSQLKSSVKELAVRGATNLNLRKVRALIKKNPGHLGHIKTAGKGRTKAVIVKDLWKWIDDHEPKDSLETEEGGSYHFNGALSARFPKQFMVKEHYPFAAQILSEYRENGWYKSWEDVEQRVRGFKRTMITDRDRSFAMFVDPGHPDYTFCGTKRLVMPAFDVNERKEDPDNQESDDEDSGASTCMMSFERMEDLMQTNDPRQKQEVPPRSDKIVQLVLQNRRGHWVVFGSGTLFENKYVLTAGHIFFHGRGKKFGKPRTNCQAVIMRHDGVCLGKVKQAWFPSTFSMETIFASATRTQCDLAVCELMNPVAKGMVNNIYPLFVCPREGICKEAQIRIDGYPQFTGPSDPKNRPICRNGYNLRGSNLTNLWGTDGNIRFEGMKRKSLRTDILFSGGTSGAPAFLTLPNGEYLVTQKGSMWGVNRPLLYGVAVNLGGSVTGDNTVCTPINVKSLKFISEAVGHDVANVEGWSPKNAKSAPMMSLKNPKRGANKKKFVEWKAPMMSTDDHNDDKDDGDVKMQ